MNFNVCYSATLRAARIFKSIIAVLCAALLSCSMIQCSSMYQLNQAIKYEYKYNRDANVKSQTQINITNKNSNDYE